MSLQLTLLYIYAIHIDFCPACRRYIIAVLLVALANLFGVLSRRAYRGFIAFL